MRVYFSEDDSKWWFDPETGEYEYGGPNPIIRYTLRNMMRFEDVEAHLVNGLSHPGEEWEPLSPEDRKDKILNILTSLTDTEIHEQRETEHY